MCEDYSRSRPLATIEHLGRTFRVVRRRHEGKLWRGYLTLAYEGVAMTSDYARVENPSDVAQVTAYWTEKLRRLFPDNATGRANMAEGIAICFDKYGPRACKHQS